MTVFYSDQVRDDEFWSLENEQRRLLEMEEKLSHYLDLAAATSDVDSFDQLFVRYGLIFIDICQGIRSSIYLGEGTLRGNTRYLPYLEQVVALTQRQYDKGLGQADELRQLIELIMEEYQNGDISDGGEVMLFRGWGPGWMPDPPGSMGDEPEVQGEQLQEDGGREQLLEDDGIRRRGEEEIRIEEQLLSLVAQANEIIAYNRGPLPLRWGEGFGEDNSTQYTQMKTDLSRIQERIEETERIAEAVEHMLSRKDDILAGVKDKTWDLSSINQRIASTHDSYPIQTDQDDDRQQQSEYTGDGVGFHDQVAKVIEEENLDYLQIGFVREGEQPWAQRDQESPSPIDKVEQQDSREQAREEVTQQPVEDVGEQDRQQAAEEIRKEEIRKPEDPRSNKQPQPKDSKGTIVWKSFPK